MRRVLPIALIGLGMMMTGAGDASAQKGKPASRVDTFTVAMPGLEGRERTVRVYLPPGYDASGARFPVLYLQDGQSLFSPGAYGDWRVDETLDSLVAAGRTPGLIVVGIDNGPRRWDEYGPWRNPRMHAWVDSTWSRAEEGGQGAAYVDFLVSTLKPMIDGRYRTRPEPAATGIGGSSMGGLIALYAGLTRPDVFGRVMAMSPAVWFAEGGGAWMSDNRLLRLIAQGRPSRGTRWWVDVGTRERSRETDPDVTDDAGERVTYPRAYIEGAQAVIESLHRRGVPARNRTYFIEEGAVHHESAWAIRFEEAVLWLFP